MNAPTPATGNLFVRAVLALIAAAVLLYLLAPNFGTTGEEPVSSTGNAADASSDD